MTKSARLAIEIGGTFTDIILLDWDGSRARLRTLKVPTNPGDLKSTVLNAVDASQVNCANLTDVMHGSTIATNAVLERKGVPTALLVTQGFQDILEIQRGDKLNIYDIFYRRPPPVVPRQWVMPVPERLDAAGTVLRPLDEDAVRALIPRLVAGGIRTVAICLLHSYINPANEARVRELVADGAPELMVVTSSELIPQFREYERASTVALSAYISPIMSTYVEELSKEFSKRGFAGSLFVTQSNGGVLPATAIRREAVRTLLSGPAAGVTGAIDVASRAGLQNIIAFDMGGTSTDVCLVRQGMPSVTTENTVAGLPVAVPMIDIVTVGAGGGSIAHVDDHAMLHVGPQSAGADPGPACYRRGGLSPTVTDANVTRGIIRAKSFADGAVELDAAAGEAAMAQLGRQLGMTSIDVADAIIRIVEANMLQAIRLVSTQRGYDPREYALVAFGGAGPIHAASVAGELGIRQVLVPAHAGVLSAFGLLVASISRDYVQTHVNLADSVAPADIQRQFLGMIKSASAEFSAYGFDATELVLSPTCDARYEGQAYELAVPVELGSASAQSIRQAFHDAHRRRYGFAFEGERVEIVNYRLNVAVPKEANGLSNFFEKHGPVVAEASEIFIDGQLQTVTFYRGETLTDRTTIVGPAVVEEAHSTCFVPAGWHAATSENGALLLEKIAS